MPVKVGDRVLVICCQRSLEKWKRNGTLDTPGSSAIHDLNGAVAIPGMYPTNEEFPLEDNLLLQFGSVIVTLIEDSEFRMQVEKATFKGDKDGKFQLGNGAVELIDILIQGLEQLKAVGEAMLTVTFPTSLGPTGTVIDPSPWQQIVQTTTQLIEKLTQLKA
jgi:hypothetical protein